MSESIYNGDLVAGSLLVRESRKVADLLLQGVGMDTFYEKVAEDNLLQKKSYSSTVRQARLIRNRLILLDKQFWVLVRDGSHDAASQVLFCATIKHSKLLCDFLASTLRMKINTFQKSLTLKDWDHFFEECKHVDPSVGKWSESTTKKIRQVIFRILAEANVLESTRTMNILPFHLLPEVKHLLTQNDEMQIMRALEFYQ